MADPRPFVVTVQEDTHSAWLGTRVPPGPYELTPGPGGGQWLLTPAPPAPRPYRVVDRYERGWLTCDEVPATYPELADAPGTYADLVATRGPLRPVVAMPGEDRDELRRVLARAGAAAVATVLVAVRDLVRQYHDRDGHDGRLVAGRPGSWESAAMLRLGWTTGVIADHRVDRDALLVLTATVRRWVDEPTRFVEVAENLASVFGRVVDGRGGWGEVTDRLVGRHPQCEAIRGWLSGASSWYPPFGL